MPATIERTSIERLELKISSDSSLVGATVDFQFLADGVQPSPGGWVAGIVGESTEVGCDSWLTEVQTPVIGPGFLVIPPGQWVVWVRLTFGGEQPVMKVGTLVVL